MFVNPLHFKQENKNGEKKQETGGEGGGGMSKSLVTVLAYFTGESGERGWGGGGGESLREIGETERGVGERERAQRPDIIPQV